MKNSLSGYVTIKTKFLLSNLNFCNSLHFFKFFFYSEPFHFTNALGHYTARIAHIYLGPKTVEPHQRYINTHCSLVVLLKIIIFDSTRLLSLDYGQSRELYEIRCYYNLICSSFFWAILTIIHHYSIFTFNF